MLPDFPVLKRQIAARLRRAAQSTAEADPLLSSIASFQQHEGDRTGITRSDGSTDTITYDTPFTAEVIIPVDGARREGGAASIRAMREVGEKLAKDMSKRMFEKLTEAADAVGNVVDGKGQPLSVDLYLELLEKMELVFDGQGRWEPPTLVLPPNPGPKTRATLHALDNDPDIKVRIEAVVNRKRKEWHAREAGRTVVD